MTAHAPRMLLLLLLVVLAELASLARGQRMTLGCDGEDELLGNLRWLRNVCTEEGESFADTDTLVPSTVATAGCAQAVRRVAGDCGGLLARSAWFSERKKALDAAAAEASELPYEPVGQERHVADPAVTVVHDCGAIIDDGFAQFPTVYSGLSRIAIDVGPSRGFVRLDFEDLTLDAKKNDNLRLYSDANENDEVAVILPGDLPLAMPAAVAVAGSEVHLLLVSDGADSRTSLRATVSCMCEDSTDFVDTDGDGCSAFAVGGTKHPHCTSMLEPTNDQARDNCPLACGACEVDPCMAMPCAHGGTCTPGAGATCAGSDLTERAAAVTRECCDEPTEDCSSGQPATCNAGCAMVLISYFQDCHEALLANSPDVLEAVSTAVKQCSYMPLYQCSCATGWSGDNCMQATVPPHPTPPATALPDGFDESYTITGCAIPAHCGRFWRVAAHCTDTTSSVGNCPGQDSANGNTDPTLCDGAPVYQKPQGERSGEGGGPVLYRWFDGQGGTRWFVGPADALENCNGSGDYLDSAAIVDQPGSAPTSTGYSSGKGWIDYGASSPGYGAPIHIAAGGGGDSSNGH